VVVLVLGERERAEYVLELPGRVEGLGVSLVVQIMR